MKKLPFFIIILLLTLSLSAQKKQLIEKENPPGTIWLRDNLYIDIGPVCNVHYREYEYVMRRLHFNLPAYESFVDTLPYCGFNYGANKEKIAFAPYPDSQKYKIDTSGIVTWGHYPAFYDYLTNPKFNLFPVINISYEVAEAYCKWRTNVVMFYYAIRGETNESRAKMHKKIKYRLITEEEWEYAIKTLKVRYPDPKANLLNAETFLLNEEKPKKKQVFHLSNFSEMLTEKQIAKGNSWKDHTPIYNPNSTYHYQNEADWLTFRCICEVED